MKERLGADDIMRQIYEIEYALDWEAVRAGFGEHVSRKIGAGFRFAGIRPQEVWPTGRPDERLSEVYDETYVRVWHTTRQIRVYVLDDLSGSMAFGVISSKRERVARIDGAVAYSASRRHDVFSYIGFADRVEPSMCFGEGDRAKDMPRLIVESRLQFASGRKGAAGFADAVLQLPRNEPALVFVPSDFWPQENFLPFLAAAAELHDVVPIVLRDTLEEKLPDERGYVSLEDAENGEEILVPLGVLTSLREENERLKAAFNELGIDAVWCTPAGNDLAEVNAFFLRRLKA